MTSAADRPRPPARSETPQDVRQSLVTALELDLIGPRTGHAPHDRYAGEVLPIAPSKWYLSGFLCPYEAPASQRRDDDADDTLDEVRRAAPSDDDSAPEAASARRAFFPSSLGLSVLLPAEVTQLRATVRWADYVPIPRSATAAGDPTDAAAADGTPAAAADAATDRAAPHIDPLSASSSKNLSSNLSVNLSGNLSETSGDSRRTPTPGAVPAPERAGRGHWRRVPQQVECVLDLRGGRSPIRLPGFPDLHLMVSLRPVRDHGLLPPGTRSVSVFLVNQRPPAPDATRDAAYLFQPQLVLHSSVPFVPRPDLHGQGSDDSDERVADLQYRDVVEYAVGHNVSALALPDADGRCREVHSTWMPVAQVEKVVAADLDVNLGMEALATCPTAQAVQTQLAPLLSAYARWIDDESQRAQDLPDAAPGGDPDASRRGVALGLLRNARRVLERMQAGLDALADPQVLTAFRLANRTSAIAMRQRLSHNRPEAPPSAHPPTTWRPFQLAFLLTNLVGIARPDDADRRVVDLLFFPTGGGKTEAYLGLAAFAMVLRRLRDPSRQSAGVSVLMRYTLRLLTLDQLDRAATLVCALELERQQNVALLGDWPFELGLWVGLAATPNQMGRRGDGNSNSALARTIRFLNDSGRNPSPIPLEKCPWCGWKFSKDSFKLLPNSDEPSDLRVMCEHRACAFHGRRQARGLPILGVDEPIYRRLPAFLIATVDKFASLPWVGETAGLFGRVDRFDDDGFYGAAYPGRGKPLKRPLPPPDLVIQDELHLISGPLGTMVGLYESVIDALCSPNLAGAAPRPKIIASTATVRRAERQIRALFGRQSVEIFPPPGPDRRDSFFAKTVSPQQQNPRTYVGIAAQGRNIKVVLLRTYLCLMAAAQKAWDENGGDKNPDNPADPYMTLLGYFSSLRELGGSRRIVEDEVRTRLTDYFQRRLRIGESQGLFRKRSRWSEPRELTSRVPTHEVAQTKDDLKLRASEKGCVDVALATNMISVGLDITRLGLMVVLGQPKTASEYIQATSRVGRDERRPGLVVTLLNIHRPRDRSHYERFTAWHDCFYRSVEATSVTPFSPRAIDRGIAAATVALARLGHPGLTAPRSALAINKHRAELGFVADVLSQRAEAHDAQQSAEQCEALRSRVRNRVDGLLDAWQGIAHKTGELQYAMETGTAPPLLFDPLDTDLAKRSREAQQFKAPRSLRDVEPTVNLWLRNPDGTPMDGEPDEDAR